MHMILNEVTFWTILAKLRYLISLSCIDLISLEDDFQNMKPHVTFRTHYHSPLVHWSPSRSSLNTRQAHRCWLGRALLNVLRNSDTNSTISIEKGPKPPWTISFQLHHNAQQIVRKTNKSKGINVQLTAHFKKTSPPHRQRPNQSLPLLLTLDVWRNNFSICAKSRFTSVTTYPTFSSAPASNHIRSFL